MKYLQVEVSTRYVLLLRDLHLQLLTFLPKTAIIAHPCNPNRFCNHKGRKTRTNKKICKVLNTSPCNFHRIAPTNPIRLAATARATNVSTGSNNNNSPPSRRRREADAVDAKGGRRAISPMLPTKQLILLRKRFLAEPKVIAS